MFFVGQRVVCVNARRWPRGLVRFATLPKEGTIYTVRALLPESAFPKGTFVGPAEDALHLFEIANPVRRIGGRKFELAFRVSRFRPVRTTNIDVFLRMLEPVPTHQPGRIDLVGWVSERRDA
jgi:hypothetical protein